MEILACAEEGREFFRGPAGVSPNVPTEDPVCVNANRLVSIKRHAAATFRVDKIGAVADIFDSVDALTLLI